MSAGGELVAVPIESVREILEVGRLTPLPRTPDFVRGVMNLRGAVVPVVDLSARIEHGSTSIGREAASWWSRSAATTQTTTRTALPVTSAWSWACWWTRSSKSSTLRPNSSNRCRCSAPGSIRTTSPRWRGRASEVVAVLDLPHLLSVRDLANAIAAHQPQ
jgi:hypothetical protein